MFRLLKFYICSLCFALSVNQAYAQEKPAAVVNGVAIPQAQVNLLIKAAALQGKPDTPEQRKSTQDYLVNREIMAQEAIQRGYDKQPETISQFELARQTVLVNAFLQDHIKNHPVTEDAIKKEYEALKKEAGSKEYGLRHILAKDESEAKSIAAQIKKGAKFEDLAKKYSLDPGSKDKGGSLGWVMPTNFIPTFADAFVNLKKGGVSSPIKVEDGWHLIKVDDVRDFKFPSYRDLKGKITLSLQQQGIQKTIVDMRAKAKIE